MQFSDYLNLEEDHIGLYIEYCAYRDGVTIEEAARRSLGRLFGLSQKSDYPLAILTAFRGERSIDENRALNKQLERDLRALGFGFAPVMGGYVEKARGETGEETGELKKTDAEESYFITGRKDPQSFEANVIDLLKKYDQESAVVKYPGDEQGYLLTSAGDKIALGAWSFNKLADFYTRMRKGPPHRQFAFEAVGDCSRSTMYVLSEYLKRNESLKLKN